MKTRIPLTALAALTASSSLYAQTPVFSEPSGYTTQVMKPSLSNNVGFNILTPSLAAGAISAVSGDGLTLTDSTASLASVIPSGKMCTIEITSGTATGAVREFVSFTATTVSISAAISDLAIGDKYIIRKNATVQEVFPLGAPLTGAAVSPDTADIVWVPDGIGGYTRYWYKNTTTEGSIGWWTTADGLTRGVQITEDIPLLYTDSITVERKSGSDVDLILDGQVKTTGSTPYTITGFNDVSINPPVGLTLFTSGLQAAITGSETAVNADKVWVPDGLGGYTKYWNRVTFSPTGWRTTTTGSDDTGPVSVDVDLTPGIRIERNGAAKFMAIDVPSSYSGL